jgi:hypothetical protein
MNKLAPQKFNITVAFCEDENANEIAFENAVRCVLFMDERRQVTTNKI